MITPRWLKLALIGAAGSQVCYWGLKLANPYLTPADYWTMVKALFALGFVGLMLAVFGGNRAKGGKS